MYHFLSWVAEMMRSSVNHLVYFAKLVAHGAVSLARRSIISYSWWAALFQVPLIITAICWLLVSPAPGFAVALLAFAAGVMAVRGEHFTRAERVIWTLIAGALCFVEFRALILDRQTYEFQQAEIREQDDISRRLDRRQFSALLKQGKGLLAEQKHYGERAVNMMTGGNSFAVMIFLSNPGLHLPIITDAGKFPLSGLAARVVNLNTPHAANSMASESRLDVGYLSPGQNWSYPHELTGAELEKQDFIIFFSANNGFWNEELHIRTVKATRVQALKVTSFDGKTRLRLCVDKDYPRDFQQPEMWEDRSHSLCPPIPGTSMKLNGNY